MAVWQGVQSLPDYKDKNMNNTALTALESKILVDFLVLPESAQDDLYSEASQKAILDNIALTSGLVYEPTDEGEKAMNADATAINKYATVLDKTAAAIFKRRTESANAERAITKGHVTVLLDNRKNMITQFAELKRQRLAAIKSALQEALVSAWQDRGVTEDFRSATVPEPKQSQLTSKGALTTATKNLIEGLAQADYAWQTEMNSRTMLVELECRRAGIDTPFSPVYIGPVFYDKSRQVFDDRLKALIKEDATRKQEQEKQLREKLESEHRKNIDDALMAQQAESDRIAKENAQAETNRLLEEAKRNQPPAEEKKEPVAPVNIEQNRNISPPAVAIKPAPQLAEQDPVKNPETLGGKIIFTATFLVEVEGEFSKTDLIADFSESLPKVLFDKLQLVEVDRDS
jgi:hypothetical protein